MFYFAIIAYLSLYDYFVGVCNNLSMCFSVIFDMSLKVRISKLYATLDNYKEHHPYFLDGEDIFDFLFVLIVVSCLWTWTFTCNIYILYSLYFNK